MEGQIEICIGIGCIHPLLAQEEQVKEEIRSISDEALASDEANDKLQKLLLRQEKMRNTAFF